MSIDRRLTVEIIAILLLALFVFVSYVVVRQYLPVSFRRMLVLTFPVLFVLLTAGAILLGRRRLVRQGYLAVFFSLLLVVNLTSVTLLPIDDLHKFSGSAGPEEVVYQMYVVDEQDNQLRFDRRIVPTMSPPTEWPGILMTCSPQERIQIGRYLLSRAQTYRESITQRSFPNGDWFDFPRHHLDYRWTKDILSSYERFTRLVIDKVTIRFEKQSYEVAARNSSTVFDVDLPDDYSPPKLSAVRRCL